MHRNAFYALALLILAVDQATKAWLRARLPVGDSVPLLPGVFHITHTRNTGMAFSLLEGATPVLVGAALVVVAAIVRTQIKAGPRLPPGLGLGLALALGGALGNLVDRLRLGYVTDMFDLTLIRFPVFNVADSAITVGIAVLAWAMLTAPETAGSPPPAAAGDGPPPPPPAGDASAA
jgi:signal peptidase II